MKLSFSPASPFARKVRIAAIELGLLDQIEFISATVVPGQPNDEYSRITPLKKLPVLILDNGDVILDSYVIVEYLDELAGGTLFPRSGPARWQALTLQSLADGMLDAALLARYEDVVRPEALRWPEWRAAQLDKLSTSLASLEATTGTLANRVDIGTLSLGCALWYADLRFPDLNWRPHYPRVAAWAEAFGKRPSMHAVWAL